MTKSKMQGNSTDKILNTLISSIMLVITLLLGTVLSGEMTEYVKYGVNLAVNCVLPSSFPFMIISDLYINFGKPEQLKTIRWVITRVFGFNDGSLAAFLCGNIGGFPIGAKMTSDAYSMGAITKEEAERLLPLSNNPSCAFVMGGIGLGIFGNMKVGLILLLSLYLSVCVCSIITKCKTIKNEYSYIICKQKYSFVESIKTAGMSSISLISFISLFSVIVGLLKKRLKNKVVFCLICCFIEVTNAIESIFAANVFSERVKLSLVAFSLGFGGICVAMQSAAFASVCDLGMQKYIKIKLLEGMICALFFNLFFFLIK